MSIIAFPREILLEIADYLDSASRYCFAAICGEFIMPNVRAEEINVHAISHPFLADYLRDTGKLINFGKESRRSKYIIRYGEYDIAKKESGSDRWRHCIVKYGRIDLIKYAHENQLWSTIICSSAVKYNQFDILRYAYENKLPWNRHVCYNAVIYDRFEMLKYAHERGCEWDGNIYHYAVRCRRLDMLKYIYENICPQGGNYYILMPKHAIKCGYFDVIRFAQDRNIFSWPGKTYKYAIKYDRFNILQYAHESGHPWDHQIYEFAIEFNRENAFLYAFENGCPWNKHILDYAAEMGRFENILHA